MLALQAVALKFFWNLWETSTFLTSEEEEANAEMREWTEQSKEN